jgi:hypothetical protein
MSLAKSPELHNPAAFAAPRLQQGGAPLTRQASSTTFDIPTNFDTMTTASFTSGLQPPYGCDQLRLEHPYNGIPRMEYDNTQYPQGHNIPSGKLT